MSINDMGRSQQAAMNSYHYGQLGGPREVKDPTITDAQDAIEALRKRKEQIAKELAEMAARGPRLQAEAARIDRMLAAAAPVDP